MAGILFDCVGVALTILPLMLNHLIRLTALAVLSQHSAAMDAVE
ncbi:hypothetical protein AB4Z52_30420 [Rhizobium sp. 2YAF20]